MEIADTSKVDAPFIMHQACNRSYPNWDFVKFMFTTYDCKIFDMKLIFIASCTVDCKSQFSVPTDSTSNFTMSSLSSQQASLKPDFKSNTSLP
jgi:hypothetical protein